MTLLTFELLATSKRGSRIQGDTRECSHLWTTSTSFTEGEGLRISELMRRLLFERPCTRATPFLTSTLVMPQFIGTSAQKFRLRLYHTVVNIVVILLRLLVHLLGSSCLS